MKTLKIGIVDQAPWYRQLRMRLGALTGVEIVSVGDADLLVCQHADAAAGCGQPVLFPNGGSGFGLQEVITRQPVTVTHLWYAQGESCICVGRAVTSTRHLWRINQEHAQEKVVSLIIQVITGMQSGQPLPDVNADQAAPRVDMATVRQRLTYIYTVAQLIFKRLRDKMWQKLGWRQNVWQLYLMHNLKKSEFTKLLPDNKDLTADPFIFTYQNQDYLFFEHLPPGAPHGQISVCTLGPAGVTAPPVAALALDYHVSYPQVFSWQGDIFMLPETSANQRLELWRAVAFPYEWELYQTALEGISVADATIWHDQDDIWLFANLSFDRFHDHNTELHIYKLGANLLQDLTPHACNPVVLDSRYARGAGALYKDATGRLIRPSQCNDYNTYGRALNLMEVQVLSLTAYAETCQQRIDLTHRADWVGIHHLARWGNKYVVDICHRWERRS